MTTSTLKLVIFIFILLIVAVTWVSLTKKQYSTDTRAYADVSDDSLTPIPTVIIPDEIETAVMDSPDGEKTLIMDRQKKGDEIKYSFYISDASDESKEFVYAKEIPSSGNMSIPYNSWSPDNKYFFLKESGVAQENYHVFFASGENFPDFKQYLNVQELFEKNIDGYEITEVTGWADPILLLVNTKETDGEKKVSFWFNVTNQSFIRLGTYFR